MIRLPFFPIVVLAVFQAFAQVPKDDFPLVMIGEEALTAKDVREAIGLTAKVSELKRRPINSQDRARWSIRMEETIIPSLVSMRLLKRVLDEEKVVRTAESDKALLARYGKSYKRNFKTSEELIALFGSEKESFRRQFEFESREEAYYQQKGASRVSPRAVSNEVKRVARRIERVKKINALAREKADKAWKRLAAGEDWNAVAEEVSEDNLIDEENGESFYRDWGEFKLKDFSPDDLAAAVGMLPVGGYTKPFETDEGMVIVKLIERKEETLKCARIAFQMAIEENPLTFDAAREKLLAKARIATQRSAIEDIRKKVTVKYLFDKRPPALFEK